jgi:hypothetical protein
LTGWPTKKKPGLTVVNHADSCGWKEPGGTEIILTIIIITIPTTGITEVITTTDIIIIMATTAETVPFISTPGDTGFGGADINSTAVFLNTFA